MRRPWRVGVVVLLASVFWSGMLAGQERLDRIRVGTVGTTADAGIYVAQEKGFFRDERIEVVVQNTFRTGGEMIPFVATGELPVAGGAMDAAFINAVRQGIHLRAVATKGSMKQQVLVVRRELFEQGLRTVAGLRGRRIAVSSPSGAVAFELQEALRTAGLTLDDVQLVTLRFPDMPVALQNGSVDAALMIEPSRTVAVDGLNAGRDLMTLDRVLPDFPIGVLFYGERMYRDRNLGIRWMAAYVRGLRYYERARREGRLEEMRRILSRYLQYERVVWERMIWPDLRPDGTFDAKYLRPLQEFMLGRRAIGGIVPTEELVDFSFLQAAHEHLRRKGIRD
ncbi:MAG: ABC transporter substrate-binding protein [Armatimonadota bacterium]|nr:ABC transporter substrate-binding protein [Armatimonadota bacterium]MDR7440413.1 ABC transporter substrate-binding protein [Armatimonadota bacterium]MDR7444553.1 ABC transporter substrate-binding protein [Armatimonadota bacterium]MDR7570322.1 ABC transporter substrate-binding protein [Armatimonadota bacterium]MDR7615344.1 ABC transporter substrate-binding protein [Armatimonadota bacterium]